MEDIQSWWELPSIAHFCSLFRAAFDLLDFDIEELEEAILTDGLDGSGSPLLVELLVRLIRGCLPGRSVNCSNYDSYLKKLFRHKCQENPSIPNLFLEGEFRSLPLRKKVEILHALCDFRLEAEDVLDLLKNLETESLRVEPLGFDDKGSTYWYFYGTRLYREDNSIFHPFRRRPKEKEKHNKKRKRKKQSEGLGESAGEEDEQLHSPWQVQCYSEEDWKRLSEQFEGCESRLERSLLQTLKDDFLPEIPRLFEEKEKIQQKRIMEFAPRRTSGRVQKLKEKKMMEECPANTFSEDKKEPLKPIEENDGTPDGTKDTFHVPHIKQEPLDESFETIDPCSNGDNRLQHDLGDEEEVKQSDPKSGDHLNEKMSRNASPTSKKTRRKKKKKSEVELFDKRKERWRGSEEDILFSQNINASPKDTHLSTVERLNDPIKNYRRKYTKINSKKSRNKKFSIKKERVEDEHQLSSSDNSNKENHILEGDSPSGMENNEDMSDLSQPQLYKGRKTNNSLSSLAFSLTPSSVVPDPPPQMVSPSSTKKKVKSAHMLLQTEDDLRTGMYKVLEHLKDHEDAWPFVDPVDDSFAPNYYAVIRRPMYITRMESRLDSGFYTSLHMFESDFKLMMDNCKLYNGPDSEYTHMAFTLEKIFGKLKSKYLESEFSSDEEIYIDLSFQQSFNRKKRRSTEEKENVEVEEDKKKNMKRGRLKDKKKVGRKPKIKVEEDNDEPEEKLVVTKRPRGRPKYTEKLRNETNQKINKETQNSKEEKIDGNKDNHDMVEDRTRERRRKRRSRISPVKVEKDSDIYDAGGDVDDFVEAPLLVCEDLESEADPVLNSGSHNETRSSDLEYQYSSSPRNFKSNDETPSCTRSQEKRSDVLSPKKISAKRGRPSKKDLLDRQLKKEEVITETIVTPCSDSESDSEGGVFLYYKHEESDNEERSTSRGGDLNAKHSELFGEIDDIDDEIDDKSDAPKEGERIERKSKSERKKDSKEKRHHHHHHHKRSSDISSNKKHHHHHHHHHHKKKSRHGSRKVPLAVTSDVKYNAGSLLESSSQTSSLKIEKVSEVYPVDDAAVSEINHTPLTPPSPSERSCSPYTTSSASALIYKDERRDDGLLLSPTSSSHSGKKKKSKHKGKHEKKNKHKPNRGKNRDKLKNDKHDRRNNKKKKNIKKKKRSIPADKMASIDALSVATEQTLKDITSLLDDPDVPRFAGESPPHSPLDEFDSQNYELANSKIELEYMKKLKMEPNSKQHKKKRKEIENMDGKLPLKKKFKKEKLENKENDKEEGGFNEDSSSLLDNSKDLFRDIKDGRIKPGAIIKSKSIAKREGVVKKETKPPSEPKSKPKPNPFGKINKQENSKLTTLIAKAKESRHGLVPNSELGDSPKLSLGSIILFGDIGSRKHSSREPNSADEEEEVSVENYIEREKNESVTKDELSDSPSQPGDEIEEERIEIEEEEIHSPMSERMIVDDIAPPSTPREMDFRQERATPNLSAWFKAFGGPKMKPSSAKSDVGEENDEERDVDESQEIDVEQDINILDNDERQNLSQDETGEEDVEIRVCSPVESIPNDVLPPSSPHAPLNTTTAASPEPPPMSPSSPEPPISPGKPPPTPWFNKVSEKEEEPIWKKNKTDDDDEDPYQFEEEELDRAREEAKKMEVERQRKASVSSSGLSDPSPLNIDSDRSPAAFSSEGERSPLICSPLTPGFGGSAKQFSPVTEKSPSMSAYSPRFDNSLSKSYSMFDEKNKYQANSSVKVGFYQDMTDKSSLEKSDQPKNLDQKFKESPIYSPTVPYVSPLYSGKDQSMGKQKSPGRFNNYYTSIDSSTLDKPPPTPGYYHSPAPSTPSDKISSVSASQEDKSKPQYNYYSYDPNKSLTDQYKNTTSKPFYPVNDNSTASTSLEKSPVAPRVVQKIDGIPPSVSSVPTSKSTNDKSDLPPLKKRQNVDKDLDHNTCVANNNSVSPWGDKREEIEKTLSSAPFRNPFSPHSLPANLANLSHIVSRIPEPDINDSLISGPKDSLKFGSDQSHSQSIVGKTVQSSHLYESSSHPSNVVPVPDMCSPLADLSSHTSSSHLSSKTLVPPAAHQKTSNEVERPGSRSMPPPPGGEKSHSYLHAKTMWNSSLPCSIPSSLTSLVSNAAMASFAFAGQKGLSPFSSDPLAQFGMDRAALASLTSRTSQGASQLFHHDFLPRNSSAQNSVGTGATQSSPNLSSVQSHFSNPSGNASGSHSRNSNSISGNSTSGSSNSSSSNSSNSNNPASNNFDLSLARSYANFMNANQSLVRNDASSSPFLNQSQTLGAALGMAVSNTSRSPTPAHQQSLSSSNFSSSRSSRESISQSHSSLQIPNLNSISSSQAQSLGGHINTGGLASYCSRDSLALMSQASRNPLVDPTSQQLYQQYLQRHQLAQEELLLRSAGAHSQLAHQSMMLQQGLISAAAGYPSGYPHSLGLRSGPYQGMNRPWT